MQKMNCYEMPTLTTRCHHELAPFIHEMTIVDKPWDGNKRY